MNGVAAKVYGWFDERLDLTLAREHLAGKTVPVHRYTVLYLFGGLTAFFFAVQVVTGVLLMLYYRPTANEAFESIEFIMTEVPYGWLVRSVHAWSAHLMIFFAVVHLVTVFFTKAFRKPRELTWMTGCLMFFLILGFGFSGSLLPWNQLAFFATSVAAGLAGSVPVAGEWILRVLLGGDRVGGATLGRFYTLHVFLLPILTMGLVALHLHLVQRHGMSIPPSVAREGRKPRSVKFFPGFLLRDLICWLVSLAALLILASRLPEELGQKADAFSPAYEDIRPEWYFEFMQQSLRLMPPGEIAGVRLEVVLFMLLNLGGGFLLAVPFLDRVLSKRGRSSWLTVAGAAGLGYAVIMTAWGQRSTVPLIVAAVTGTALFMLILATGPRRGGANR